MVFFIAFSTSVYAAERICEGCFPKSDGDFVHRSDSLTPGWIGHAGIKLTPRGSQQSSVYDVAPGRPGGKALRSQTFEEWRAGFPFWGAKRSSRMDQRRLNMMSARLQVLLRMETEYDGNHLNQKGETMKRPDGRSYFEADCVGFVEGLHEATNDELTPSSQEGALLLVQTQRDFSSSTDVGK